MDYQYITSRTCKEQFSNGQTQTTVSTGRKGKTFAKHNESTTSTFQKQSENLVKVPLDESVGFAVLTHPAAQTT